MKLKRCIDLQLLRVSGGSDMIDKCDSIKWSLKNLYAEKSTEAGAVLSSKIQIDFT